MAEDKIRATLSFILFDQKSFSIQNNEKITFAQLVRDVFKNWLNRKNDWIVRHTYNELTEPDGETFVFWKICRKKCAIATILYAIIPFYKIKKNKPDKHGELILKLLNCLIDNKKINKKHIKYLDSEYYWHDKVPVYLKKAIELLDMTDDKFMNLPEFDTWLND